MHDSGHLCLVVPDGKDWVVHSKRGRGLRAQDWAEIPAEYKESRRNIVELGGELVRVPVRSRRSTEYSLVKIGVDTAENEPEV